MYLLSFYLILWAVICSPGQKAFGENSFQESGFYSRLSTASADLCPCTTPEVQGAEMILSSTWCLTASPADSTPEGFITGENPASPWILVTRPREMHALAVERGLIPDPRRNRNLEQMSWLNDTSWWLAYEFNWPSGVDVSNRMAILDGLFGVTSVWMNGNPLQLEKRGFTTFEADLGESLHKERRNRLVIRFDPTHGPQLSPSDLPGMVLHRCGLEGKVRIAPQPEIRIDGIAARVGLAEDRSLGTVDLTIHVSNRSSVSRRIYTYASLRLPEVKGQLSRYHHWGRPELLEPGENRFQLRIEEENPRLWWPRGVDESHVYPLRVRIRQLNTVLAERWVMLGFRTVDWREDGTLLVNNTPVPIYGTEWTSTDPFHPNPSSLLVEPFQRLFQSNLNALWVGRNRFEDSLFYDACDSAGILVLQEIPTEGHRLNQETLMNLETHPCVVGWTSSERSTGTRDSALDSFNKLNHQRPIVSITDGDHTDRLSRIAPLVAPNLETWVDFLDKDERGSPPPAWKLPKDYPYRDRFDDWYGTESLADTIRTTQSIQANILRRKIENTRIHPGTTPGFIAGKLAAVWPGISSALIDTLGRPTKGFWAVKRSCEPAILSLRRNDDRFEAWLVNSAKTPVNGLLMVFDPLAPASDRRAAATVDVPAGTAALVWSSTPESWAERALRDDDLPVLGAFAGEPLTFSKLARAAVPMLTLRDGSPIPGLSPQQERSDPRVPPELQASLFCRPIADVSLPEAQLHIITFAEDKGPWRMTVRSFERRYIRNVRISFDPPDAAWISDQHFDVLPDAGRLVTIQPKVPGTRNLNVTVTADNAPPVSFMVGSL